MTSSCCPAFVRYIKTAFPELADFVSHNPSPMVALAKYIKRTDPGFICISLISKKDVCENETQGLIDKLFGGSKKALFSALLEDEKLTQDEIDEIRRLIEKR